LPQTIEADFKVCNNHILVERTVLGIFTKISLVFASFWFMLPHHIPEEHNHQPHSCDNLRTQKKKKKA
jgi:hypothetical protein